MFPADGQDWPERDPGAIPVCYRGLRNAEIRNYLSVREFRNDMVTAIKLKGHIEGQFLRLKKQFLATKLIWKQSEMLPV